MSSSLPYAERGRGENPLLIGFSDSVYVRIVRLVALEKGVALDRQELDPFAGPSPELLALNPFGKVPVLRYGDLTLYETQAITGYLDEGFPGPALQPAEAIGRARLRQILGIADAYAYRALVWDLYVASREGAVAESALRAAARVLAVLETLAQPPWLSGRTLTLADCHLAPMIRYLIEVPAGRDLLGQQPRLVAWWERCRARRSWETILTGET